MGEIKIVRLSADHGPIVGTVMVAHASIVESKPAEIKVKNADGSEQVIEVPLNFYTGDLNLIKTAIQKTIDDAMIILENA